MRKQTKLVAVLSAAALLAVGASMTSFAGWEKDEDGIWHYYDSDDQMVEGEWRKDGSKWFYLDEDGNMATDTWVDDDYYVGEDGAMVKNDWRKTFGEDEEDDPDQDEHWYYFGSNGKMYKDAAKKKVNGKYYFFNAHGQMLYEWINNQKYAVSSSSDLVSGNYTDTQGNVTNYQKPGAASSNNGILDDNATYQGSSQIWNMQYSNVVEDGSRANGWYEIDGSADTGEDGDTDWYYIDDGEPERADAGFDNPTKNDYATHDDDGAVYVARIKVPSQKMGKVYFAFNEMGQMQTGLQYIPEEKGFYYFDDLGYPVDGKVSDVECDDDSYAFRFETKNGHNGKGIQGEKDNYLYFNGKRLEADDDYKFYVEDSDVYLVNNKGKIQKSKGGKTYDEIENGYFEGKNVKVTTNNNGVVTKVEILDDDKKTVEENIKPDELVMRQVWAVAGSATEEAVALNKLQDKLKAEEGEYGDEYVAVPFIQLYDDDVYTSFYTIKADGSEFKLEDNGETWVGMNK